MTRWEWIKRQGTIHLDGAAFTINYEGHRKDSPFVTTDPRGVKSHSWTLAFAKRMAEREADELVELGLIEIDAPKEGDGE